MKARLAKIVSAALLTAMVSAPLYAVDAPPSNEPAQTLEINVDKNPRIIAYQLRRLSNADLLTVIRKSDDSRYKPIYETILTRKGLARQYRPMPRWKFSTASARLSRRINRPSGN